METTCPKCGNKLYHKKTGLVCKNWKCKNYWKMGIGPVYRWTGRNEKGEGIWKWMRQVWIPIEENSDNS